MNIKNNIIYSQGMYEVYFQGMYIASTFIKLDAVRILKQLKENPRAFEKYTKKAA